MQQNSIIEYRKMREKTHKQFHLPVLLMAECIERNILCVLC